jgi:hypothetical protein
LKYAFVCARQNFPKDPLKDDFEECAQKVIDRACFIILENVDEFDETNARLLGHYKENIEKLMKL